MCDDDDKPYVPNEFIRSISVDVWRRLNMSIRDPLLQEREKTHGSFWKNAEIQQKLLSVLKDYDLQDFIPVQRTAIEMICLKLARTMSNPKYKDNWDDIAGYAKLGAEACD
jgi:hypothetical protein